MKLILLYISIQCISISWGYGQVKPISKEEKEALKEAERIKIAQSVSNMIDNRSFVIEADYMSNKTGNKIPVSSRVNFILIDTTQAVFQLGNNSGRAGLNGIGGATIEGKITRYNAKVKTGKRITSYFITIFILTSYGNFDMFINVFDNGTADASISDNAGNKLNYYGRILSKAESRVYKGIPSR